MPNRFSLLNRIPLFNDLRRHLRADFLADAIAGSNTAILTIPQAIAYALLAGLPAQMGLYAAIIAPLVYALLGSSRTVIIGPAAVQSVMVAAALVPLGGAESSTQVAGAIIIGLGSGALLLALGTVRLGWLTNFISNPVLSGFTTGAVLYIIITQTGTLLGIPVPRDVSPIANLWSLIRGLLSYQPATAACGASAIGCIWLARHSGPLIARRLGWSPQAGEQIGRISPLLIVFIFTLLSLGFGLAGKYGVPVVGTIPQALPSLQLSMPSSVDWRRLAPDIVLIALIGYIESLSVAKALAFRRRERINPDRELVALGLTNMAVAAFGGMPVAGSFSKSVVNFEAGARTQLSGIVAAAWVTICVVALTGLLHALPRAVLAAIIIVAVSRLMDFRSIKETWRYDRGDGSAQVLTIICVLVFGIEKGLLIGAGFAASLFLYRTSRPNILEVGLVPGTQHFRSVRRNDVATYEHLLMIRIDENLYFANTPRVEMELQRLVADHPKATDVVLILSGIGYIDASSLDMLDNFEQELTRVGSRLHLAEFKSQVIDRLQKTDLFRRLGPERIHRSTYAVLMSFDPGVF